MRKSYSSHWKSSTQPRKQRKYRANAPLHVRQKLVSAHLAKDLRVQYKRRSLPVRAGDEIKVMTGEFRGQYGTVEHVNLQRLTITTENIKRRKVNGQEVAVLLQPSNVMITKVEGNERRRFAPAQARKSTSAPSAVKPAAKGRNS